MASAFLLARKFLACFTARRNFRVGFIVGFRGQ